MLVICRTDLRQLRQSPDFWGPMLAIGALFFVVIPSGLLLSITSIGDVKAVSQIGQVLEILPEQAQSQIKGTTPAGRASFALAVFLFAPLAVVVPLTISTAIGAATIVGERERGTGEFLAHSPADTREIFVGKLIASLLPGYATTLVGFGIYSLLVNLIAADEVGSIFFPTEQWLWLMFWVVPPFLGLALSTVLRLSARVRSTIAAQQASGLVSLPLIMLAYSQSTGTLFGAGLPPWFLGLVVWLLAALVLSRGMRAMNRGRLLGVASES
jgi:ABC-type Na+ efflux pump permease subunit